MTKLIAISDVRARLPELVTNINKYYDRVTITINGQPKAALLSIEELESIEETAKILSNPGAKVRIKKGTEQIRKGEFVTLADLK